METSRTLSTLLTDKLSAYNVDHIFGLPGDYSLALHAALDRSHIQLINTCDEQGAGFAADGYARMRGLGVVCVTYGVGGLKLANTTAQAYAEKSPVVILSGAPAQAEIAHDELLHHRIKDFETQINVFRHLTAYATRLEAHNACVELDRALRIASDQSLPVYIEISRDLVDRPCPAPNRARAPHPQPDTIDGRLQEAVDIAVALITAAERPVLVAGVETARRGLHPTLLQLLERSGLPAVATPLSKSVIPERSPNYAGVYAGALGSESARAVVESSDCVISLGVLSTDINSGFFTAQLAEAHTILASPTCLRIGGNVFDGVPFRAFMIALASALPSHNGDRPVPAGIRESVHGPRQPETVRGTQPVAVKTLLQAINRMIDQHTVVIADTGDAMFAAMDLLIPSQMGFMAPMYYASLGFAVPASIGVQLARPDMRPLVLVGDGAFQMTGMELSTIARYGLTPIVVVLNNRGYGTERPLLDGPYNDLWSWQYERLTDVLRTGIGRDVRTIAQLEAALSDAIADPTQFSLLNVHLDEWDFSPALKQLGRIVSQKVQTPAAG